VENLIKKHEAFEKAAAAQEERFAALERLTTFELKDMKRRQDEEQARQQDLIEKQKAAEQEQAAAASRQSRDQTDTKSETGSLRESKAGDEELEGILVRKHEWETTTKKASNRSWDSVCVVLKGQKILFYKDQKSYRTRPEVTFRSETPVDLLGGNAEVATDYVKRDHVFRLRLANGGDYLFQAPDAEQMNTWVGAINQAAMEVEQGGSKSQTLPPGSEKKDEPKRRSFFTLKKN